MNNKKQDEILKKLKKYHEKDFSFSKGQILGSMCTQPLPIAKKAYNMFLETNIGDPKLFPRFKRNRGKISFFPKKTTKCSGKKPRGYRKWWNRKQYFCSLACKKTKSF